MREKERRKEKKKLETMKENRERWNDKHAPIG